MKNTLKEYGFLKKEHGLGTAKPKNYNYKKSVKLIC
jgi:hypothetical protein